MNYWGLSGLVVLLGLCGCAERPTRQQLISREKETLESYCSGDVVSAESDLIECIRYAQRCREAGVPGIDYEQTLARLNGRLYLVERHLGKEEQANRCLQELRARSESQGRPLAVTEDVDKLIRMRFDKGLEIAWQHPPKAQP